MSMGSRSTRNETFLSHPAKPADPDTGVSSSDLAENERICSLAESLSNLTYALGNSIEASIQKNWGDFQETITVKVDGRSRVV